MVSAPCVFVDSNLTPIADHQDHLRRSLSAAPLVIAGMLLR
jgi:hypothetical protein